MTDSPILVVGSTGLLGGEIVRQLRAADHKVRALVRSSADAGRVAALKGLGVEVVGGDLVDKPSLKTACQGVQAIVSTATSLMSQQPGDSIESVDLVGQSNLLEAAEHNRVKQFVFTSFPPDDTDYAFQRAKRSIESRLRKSGLSHTIFHAASFAEIWWSPFLGFDPLNGKARVFGDGLAPTSWISLSDVAQFAAAAPGNEAFYNKTLTLGGPQALSYLDVLELFAKNGVTQVAVEAIPETALRAQLKAASDPRQEAFAAAILARALPQLVSSEEALALKPTKLTPPEDIVTSMIATSRVKQ